MVGSDRPELSITSSGNYIAYGVEGVRIFALPALLYSVLMDLIAWRLVYYISSLRLKAYNSVAA